MAEPDEGLACLIPVGGFGGSAIGHLPSMRAAWHAAALEMIEDGRAGAPVALDELGDACAGLVGLDEGVDLVGGEADMPLARFRASQIPAGIS